MTFSIVHISDLHFKNDHPCIERVRILRDDILQQITGTKAHLIFSGDLVHAGDDNLYEVLLDQFFVHLDEACERIYLVPGNHDIQRQSTDLNQCEKFAADSNQKYLYHSDSTLKLDNPFQGSDPLQNYNDFQDLISNHQLQNYFGTLDANSDFSFLGLNSAWLCCARDHGQSDLKKLKIDPAIVEHFVEKLPNSNLKVCAFHHPLDWMEENIRQNVKNLITKNFDLVLFGHDHNPSTTSGKFNDDECLFLQAPAVNSEYSYGANAYSIINVDKEYKRYEVRYRTFSEPQKKYVMGEDITDGGVRYPSKEDQIHWHHLRTGTKSGLLSRFSDQCHEIDFSDWFNTHIVAKSKLVTEFVEPTVTRLEYNEGQKIVTKPRKLGDALAADTRIQFIIGPQDSGLTTASFLTLKHVCKNFQNYERVPVYIKLGNIKVNRASLISEAVKTSTVRYSHTEMTRLIDEGGVTFIFDEICLPETEKFNKLINTLEQYFSKSTAIIFCALDGGFTVSSETSKLMLSPLTDVVHELQPLDVRGIHDLIQTQRVNLKPREVDNVLDNVIASFKQMNEPLYPSSVALLLETLQQIPQFKPLNRVRLLDRYVECLLGRFDLEDVREGSFNSNEKSNFLAYVAGYFATNSLAKIPVKKWDIICKQYEEDKLLELPLELLKEFVEKGILILQGGTGTVTFRADYLFSYFVAKEMHQNVKVFDYISDDEAFYTNHRELVFYGELEGVNNTKLLDATFYRLRALESEIIQKYSQNSCDFDNEWRQLLDEDQEDDDAQLTETIIEIMDASPNPEAIDKARSCDLNDVDRGRGIQSRHAIKELELRWYVAIKTYLQLVKHSTNLDGIEKLKHLKKAMESSELFIKSLAVKRDLICSHPVFYHSGIIYLNPLAEFEPERAKREFKFTAPSSFAKIISDLMTNPQLSPAIRLLLNNESEIVRFLARHLLLESPHTENRKQFVSDLTSSSELVLQTCSLRRLKNKYLGYSINEEYRGFYSGIVEEISNNPKLQSKLQHSNLKKQRMLADMKQNLSKNN